MVPAPFFWQGEHLAVELPGALAVFTTRRGGFSRGAYASLNLGRWTDDDPALVERNRTHLAEMLGVAFAYGRQVHGTDVHTASAATPPGDPPAADAQVTGVSGVAPMVLTADCLPVALAGGGTVGMVHAGWRGLAGGVIAEAVAALQALAGEDVPLGAAVGPGAGPCCYEVSPEVHAEFAARDADIRRGANLDLPAIAALELARVGVAQVHCAHLCTICSDPQLFFSHRRDGGVTGRQAGVAWLS